MTGYAFIIFLIAFAAVAALLPFVRRAAVRFGLVDNPGGRKKHEGVVPLAGGLVIFPVFMILVAALQPDWSIYGPYFMALALLLVTGALDDKRGVPAWIKFAVQFIAAFLIVLPGQAQIIMLGDLFGFGRFGLNFMSIPFSVVAVVLLINAINLMDGLDGLSGGKGFIVMLGLAAACIVYGTVDALLPIAALMGALGGFLLYNMRHPFRQKASVFIGDSGSLALGLSIAWFCIHLAKGFDPVIQPISVAWLLALPIYDTCGQFARRVSQGRHPFDADHDHFHHHFIYAGFPVGQATAIILLISAGFGLIGLGGMWLGLPEAVLTYPWIALLFVHIYMSMRPHRFRRLMAKLRGAQ
ncbi:MAG: undecaprenyl/decaprenyl-phosphate alpha-N-acetylglucosaminyl 1-phosphate transferase [Rhodospirillales bacterium]|nr:undecaprenyl/decaprenyl-phosphate alpha-N-acetylglucosaminyl 1-phosphate transferase [Rhodospirillales bacterium]MCB9994940.1 undecaprenyl/decaprenyl-phosphate alpha-N-acetylglucosaminyl 1-phosphate transferase [Rhodospirillales bacterium]